MDQINKCIAQVRVDDSATVRVLSITPNQVIECDRECACLTESRDGSVQCSIGWIKKMVNFKTTALIIDYEIIMDKKADWDWRVLAADFPVIDDRGQIHKGESLCDSIVSPEGLSGGIDTIYPGTRGKYRIYYETFPKDGSVATIIIDKMAGIQGRIDFEPSEPKNGDIEDGPAEPFVAPQGDNGLRERVALLEQELKSLRADLDTLRLKLADQNSALFKHKAETMTDPGIGYHPLDNK